VFPPGRRAALDELGERSWTVLTAYVKGVVFVALVDAVGIGLGLLIIGVPLAFTWGVLAFVTNYIPNIGFLLGLVPPTLIALLATAIDTWLAALIVTVVYAAIAAVLALGGKKQVEAGTPPAPERAKKP